MHTHTHSQNQQNHLNGTTMSPFSNAPAHRSTTLWQHLFGATPGDPTTRPGAPHNTRSPGFVRPPVAGPARALPLALAASTPATHAAPDLMPPYTGAGPYWSNYQRQRNSLAQQWIALEDELCKTDQHGLRLKLTGKGRELQRERPRLSNAMQQIAGDMARLDAAAARLQRAELTREPGATARLARRLADEATTRAQEARKDLESAEGIALDLLSMPTTARGRLRKLVDDVLALDLNGKRETAQRLDLLAAQTRQAASSHAGFEGQTHMAFKPEAAQEVAKEVAIHIAFGDMDSPLRPEAPGVQLSYVDGHAACAPFTPSPSPSRSQAWHVYGTPYPTPSATPGSTPSAMRYATPGATPGVTPNPARPHSSFASPASLAFSSPSASPSRSRASTGLHRPQQVAALSQRAHVAAARRLSFSDNTLPESSVDSGTLY
jgi:hypothetical protein